MSSPRKSLEPYLKDSVEYFPHQTKGIRQLYPMPSFLLADDMGLGKSLQALTVFCIDLKLGKAETCVVVCTTTLRENWAEEIEKFTRLPYTLLGEVENPRRPGEMKTLTPAKREEQLVAWLADSGPRILITHYEQIASTKHKDTLARSRIDVGIFDEAHMIKNHAALRTKAALALPVKRSFILTGTPMLNQPNELWPLLHKINPKDYPRYWSFVNRYCVFGGYENRQITGVKNQTELNKKLGSVMVRRLKDNVLNREKPTYIEHKVGLSAVQRKLYDQLVDEMFIESPEMTIEADNELTKFLRLKQICNTPYSIDPSFPDDSLKLDRMVEVVEELASRDEKVVLFTQFRGTLEAVVNRIRAAKLGPVLQLHGDIVKSDRVPTVNKWGAVNGTSALACMTQVAGVGLNMVKASECIFIDKLFVPGLNKQAVDRLDRIGQTKPVVVHELITRGTIETRIEQILRSKKLLGEHIVEGSVGMGNLLKMLRESMKNDLS